MELKVCAKCKVTKTVDNFHICKRNGYRSRCKDCKRIDDKLWRENNKDLDRISKKKWRDENKEYMKSYYISNKDKIDAYIREYYLNNKDTIKERIYSNKNEYMKLHYRKYPHIHIHRGLLTRYYKWIGDSKLDRTHKLLGYTAGELKRHIESLFRDGMTWDNFGEWHVDHIKPVSKFDKNESPSIVNALSNLQPLWSNENLKKGTRYES